MSATSYVEELKRYVRFGDDDAAALLLFREYAAPHFPKVADTFYERIREHDAAHEVFQDEAQIARLRVSLILWLDRLLTGPHDAAYYAQTWKIGETHVRVGLPHRYMFVAMNLIRTHLLEVLQGSPLAGDVPTERALNAALDLDLCVMVSAYRDLFDERLKQTERRAAVHIKGQVEQFAQRYVSAVEAAPVMVVGLDRHGVVVLVNAAAEMVTGRSRDELTGASWEESVIDPSDVDVWREALSSSLHGTAAECEVLIRHRSGKRRRSRWQFAPETTDELVTSFAIGRDVTVEVKLAKQIEQSQRLATLGTLAAGLAHEIRNPLNGAQLHLDFLERALGKLNGVESMVEAIGVVKSEITRLSRLVTQFLDFARPKTLNFDRQSLNTLVRRAEQLVRPTFDGRGFAFEVDLPSVDVSAWVDGAGIQQVLLNLLRNAGDAVADKRGTKVLLSLRRAPHEFVVAVIDDGPGLDAPPERIFDPFFSTKEAGTGLGLSIAHRIVAEHGGHLGVETQPGQTRFFFRIPLERPDV